ncbi:2-amino-4-hydroxy-6-hydroxymethyldihydropteridine diphosphokinase [bacterium]|nr:2-amino-4-hydroxy-6-hydroxymethyldihydropteridine diphosphokinase [bacterium]
MTSRPARVTAYLGLGGNLGDVRTTLATALRALESDARTESLTCSRLYLTEPWGMHNQPEFLNLAARIEWRGYPEGLAALCHHLERQAGRDEQREDPNGPRELDLDLLLFGDRVIDSPELKVPHPSMHLRRFVLEPLNELAPDLTPPGWEQTIYESLETLEDPKWVKALTDAPWTAWRRKAG